MKSLLNLFVIASLAAQSISSAFITQRSNTKYQKDAAAYASPLLSQEQVQQDSQEPAVRPARLRLIANPQLLIPGIPFDIAWEIEQFETIQSRADLQAVLEFPNQLTSKEAASLNQDGDFSRLSLPVEQMQDSLELTPPVELDKALEEGFLVDVFIQSGEEELLSNSVLMTSPSFEVASDQDAEVVSRDGRVELNFPANSLPESLYMDIRSPSPSSVDGYSMSGNPVEIVAVGMKSLQNVTEFQQDFTISMNYDPEKIYGWAEEDLTIFYYNLDTMDWHPLETTVDAENNQLSAQVNHLTVFDYKAQSWQGSSLPTVDAAQVSEFTGAGTYNMSFWLPPGAGGFSPALSLSYNSQIIDGSTAFTQAGWVGMGWSLDTGYIELNMHGNNDQSGDDTFQLTLNGISTQLLPINTSSGITTYVAKDINYWSIQQNDTTGVWTVRDQAGTTYTFGHFTKTKMDTACVTSTSQLNKTWRYSLSSATNKFGQSITYTYENQDKSTTCKNQVAVYPLSILYVKDPSRAEHPYKIEFVTETRLDYQTAWEDSASKNFFQKKRLDRILVKHNPSGSIWNTIRQYNFTYATTGNDQIYPGFTWTKGSKTSTLISVQEIDKNNNTLPATTFSYADFMHLSQVNNGQGGTVSFAYERMTYLDDDNDDLVSLYTVFGENECNSGLGIGTLWYAKTGYGSTKCEMNMLQIDKQTKAIGIALRTFPQHIVKPGGRYRLYIRVRNIYATTGVEWGFTDPANGNDVEGIASGIGSQAMDFEVGKEMAVNFNPITTKLIIECDNCYVKKLQFMVMPIYFRVISKTIADAATGSSSVYTYTYSGTAVNNTQVSETAGRTGAKYTPTMREYRGYSTVQTLDPQGLLHTTWYLQSDLLMGKPYHSLSTSNSITDSFDTLNTNLWNFSHADTRQTLYAIPPQDSCLKSNSTAADWTTVLSNKNYSLTDGKILYTQFQVSGSTTQAQLGIETSGGDFFGLYALPNGASHDLKVRTILSGGTTDTTLLSATTFKRDTWYQVMILLDDAGQFQIRVWEKGKPENNAEASRDLNGAVNWRFVQKTNNGTVLLNTYLEGTPHEETETTYQANIRYDTIPSNGVDDITGATLLMTFVDLQAYWSRVESQTQRFYDGNASWSGTKTNYEYNTADQGGVQYGNLTRVIEQSWSSGAWVNYRASKTTFFPTATNNLTGLPARMVTLSCNPTCDFSSETGKISEVLYLYDNHNLYTDSLSEGKLTGQRTWVRDSEYSQTATTYDTFGNVTQSKTWRGYGTAFSAPTEDEEITNYSIDSNYRTYVVSESNAFSQVTAYAYNYELGLPETITDPNNQITTAEYDGFGRMKKIFAPGDSSVSPTLSIDYLLGGNRFQVNLNQKVSGSASIRITHFYNGLGELLQTQRVGTIVDGTQKTVVTDYQYDNMGRLAKETKPYSINYVATPAFQTQNFSQPYTVTNYDLLGRPLSVTEPNGNAVTYSYDGLVTTQSDPAQNQTVTTKDSWGRVVSVQPPTGPGLTYEYDERGLLKDVYKGSGGTQTHTHIDYDQGGRKTGLIDPDMGTWAYDYDALGNLISQIDARTCETILIYDNLNRLTGKIFSGPDECASTASITYVYDQNTYGVGRRTSMTDGSGSTAWSYDTRGRMISETKVISGNSFTTGWTYNSADQPLTMTYPDGEVLTYETLSDGNLSSMRNASNFYYLSSSKYDEAGRTKELKLGDNLLTKNFAYYGWTTSTKGGRLNTMTVVNSASQTLQNLAYNYDSRGNIASINDGVAGENTVFAYDALNRLEAMTTINQLFYITHSEAFSYNPGNGTLFGKGVDADNLLTYDYDDANHSHAVTGFNGNSYEYDDNGNQDTRVIGEATYTLIYDGENRLVRVTADLPLERGMGEEPTETATPIETATETPTETPTLEPTPTETPTLEPTPTETPTLEPTPTETPTPVPTETPTQEPTSTQQSTQDQVETPTIQPTLEPTLTETPTLPLVETPTVQSTPERSDEGETPEPTPTETPTETPTDTPLPEDFENPESESMLLDWEGGEIVYTYDGDGNLVKSVIDNKTTYYPNQYYEKRMVDAQQTIFKYYFVGSARIALRENGTITWLLSDHLGSTSGTVNATGALVSTMKYTAFGETRGTGSSTTDYRYTGQREEEEIGLYFYKARFFDPYLNHFTQPDTIIPDPSNPQSWNRYAYVNNNPIRYTDPSGNYIFEDEPDDPLFAPAYQGINPACRYETVGVSKSSANLIFSNQIRSPLRDLDLMPHNFGDFRGIRSFEDQWFEKKQWHASMDIGFKVGLKTSPIFPGKVNFIGWTGMGNTIIIEHNIYGNKLYSVYGHFGDNNGYSGILAHVGENVDYDSIIGITGNSKPDCLNCDPHLHFEVRYITNINLSNPSDPLMGMRYWAYEGENWRKYFFDLGKIWGYDPDNFGGW